MQLKGSGSRYRALGSPYGALGSPYRPSVPLTGALSNCLIVGHSPDFNCIGPRYASKNIGLGWTQIIRLVLAKLDLEGGSRLLDQDENRDQDAP